MISVVIYGRGGQGAKTAAHILSTACFIEGKHIQSFPEYGPERSGAPMRTFVKISDSEIKEYSPTRTADYVIIIDQSLILQDEIKSKIIFTANKNTSILVNTGQKVDFELNVNIFDASEMSLKNSGRDYSNVAILGAFAKMSKIVTLKSLEKAVEETFEEKTELIKPNIESLREAYKAYN